MNAGSVRGAGQRIEYLDAARGLAVLLMIFVNFTAQYLVIPSWTKHAVRGGFTYVDGIAPMFVFIMGISSALSFARRLESGGRGKVFLHILRRCGLLFLFGTLGTVILYFAEGILEWNIFQTLAVAGSVAFPFLYMKSPPIRMIIALALMVLYQLAVAFFLADALFKAQPPIPFLPSAVQSLALATIVIFGSGFAHWIVKEKTFAAAGISTLVFFGLGFALSNLVGPNRSMGSITYLFYGLGMSAGLLLVCRIVSGWIVSGRIPFLSVFGKNALVIFMVAAVLTKVLNALLPENTGAIAVLSIAVGLETACIIAAKIMDSRRVYVKL
jgi:predicted acyltransferase